MLRLPLDSERMRHALESLDERLVAPVHLVVGGGAAMALAYDHPLATQDVDAFTAKGSLGLSDIDTVAKQVAAELNIEPDWLNGHFVTYTGVLPQGYSARLRPVYEGARLRVDALGPEDLLIMKCFAGRDKDRSHARRLIQVVSDLDLIDAHLHLLVEKRYPGAQKAADYFDDLRDEADL